MNARKWQARERCWKEFFAGSALSVEFFLACRDQQLPSAQLGCNLAPALFPSTFELQVCEAR